MEAILDNTNLHRTAKYFMDSGRADTHEEAIGLLRHFGLTVHVGPQIASSAHHQTALLTLVNVARRTLLGGVEVVGLPDTPSISPIAPATTLKDAVRGLGAHAVKEPKGRWPSAVIGEAAVPKSKLPCWRLTWSGWRGGVIPAYVGGSLDENRAMALAPLIAASACAAEAFAFHAEDHLMAGRRTSGLSLWQPGHDWLRDDETEAPLLFLPSHLWLIGLGNLGQAFAWALTCLPYSDRNKVQLVLQDFDRISASNESTSLLAFPTDIGCRKTRAVAKWMEGRGFDTCVNERRFGAWTRRGDDEPGVALCGVDNALARAALGKPGYGLVVEAGLGAGPEAFRSLSIHTFPASRSPEEIWSRQVGEATGNVENMPAYQALKRKGMDACGLAQLASRTVAVPFVGLIAGCLTVSELLRRLNGGCAFEIVSGSAAALSAVEAVPISADPYGFGHLAASKYF
jgi:hypothetical protein